MMKVTCICDIVKAILALFGFAIFSGLCIACLINGRYIYALIFLALDIVYALLTIKNIAIIHIDEKGAQKKILGKTVMSFTWEEIKDVGLINNRFIYLSKDEMNNDDRNKMCFDWPPKDKIYFRAGKKSTQIVELMWNRKNKLFVHYRTNQFKYI